MNRLIKEEAERLSKAAIRYNDTKRVWWREGCEIGLKECIAFADWLNKNNWQNTGDDLWVNGGENNDFNDYTSEQVYDKYLQTKKH